MSSEYDRSFVAIGRQGLPNRTSTKRIHACGTFIDEKNWEATVKRERFRGIKVLPTFRSADEADSKLKFSFLPSRHGTRKRVNFSIQIAITKQILQIFARCSDVTLDRAP